MKNFESHFISQLVHILLSNLTKCPCDLLHERDHCLPLLIKLVLILFGQAKEGNAPSQDSFLITRLQCVWDVVQKRRPFLWIVITTNLNYTPNILLQYRSTLALKHLAYDVGAHIVLVIVAEDNVLEAWDANFLGLFCAKILPMIINALTKLHSSSQAQLWINLGIWADFKQRRAVIVPLLWLREELFGLLAQVGIGAETGSERLL